MFAATAITFSVFMGLWQLGLYDTRQVGERADRQDVPTVPLTEVWSPGEPFMGSINHRPVTVEGEFADAGEQLWVRAKEEAGRTGFWLVAPFFVTAGDPAAPPALMVVRGWSTGTDSVVDVPDGPQEIRVILEPGEAGNGSLDADRTADALRIPSLINQVDYDLYSGFGLNTSADAAGGLMLVSAPEVETSWTAGSRNLMYGVQWFVFGAFAAFMWWRMSTESVAAGRGQVA